METGKTLNHRRRHLWQAQDLWPGHHGHLVLAAQRHLAGPLLVKHRVGRPLEAVALCGMVLARCYRIMMIWMCFGVCCADEKSLCSFGRDVCGQAEQQRKRRPQHRRARCERFALGQARRAPRRDCAVGAVGLDWERAHGVVRARYGRWRRKSEGTPSHSLFVVLVVVVILIVFVHFRPLDVMRCQVTDILLDTDVMDKYQCTRSVT